jgi:hypothetical protein
MRAKPGASNDSRGVQTPPRLERNRTASEARRRLVRFGIGQQLSVHRPVVSLAPHSGCDFRSWQGRFARRETQ